MKPRMTRMGANRANTRFFYSRSFAEFAVTTYA